MGKNGFWDRVNESKDLMRRMGEYLPSIPFNTFYEKLDEMRLPFFINEGLISTYPSDRVISFLSKAFNLKKDEDENELSLSDKMNNRINHEYNGEIYLNKQENETETITLVLYDKTSFNDINFYMKKYGWNLLSEEGDKYTYEKKFEVETITNLLIAHGINQLYHITTEKVVNKILKQGLVPKARNDNGFINNESRIYFKTREPDENDVENFSAYKFEEELVVLAIDLEKINKTTKFYYDSRLGNSLYTYEPIPNTAITLWIKSKE